MQTNRPRIPTHVTKFPKRDATPSPDPLNAGNRSGCESDSDEDLRRELEPTTWSNGERDLPRILGGAA